MSNYFIIGGDGKQYGPITADDLRKWIGEGRLNAQTLAKTESDAEWRTLDTFPEFAEAFGVQPADSDALPASADAQDWQERDYELDLGGCISRGWTLAKENFGILFLCVLVMMLVEAAFFGLVDAIMFAAGLAKLFTANVPKLCFNYLLTAVGSLVMGPMLGGIYFVYLKVIRKQPTGIGDVFAGFQKAFAQLFLGSLIVSLITGACMLPFNYVVGEKVNPVLEHLKQAQAQHANPEDMQQVFSHMMSAYAGSLPLLLICLIPVTFLTVCWQFTLPLIMDKQMNFWPAIMASGKMVMKHWWQVFGLTILIGLISFSGALACCIGLIFTVPVGFAAAMFAYETIFNGQKTS